MVLNLNRQRKSTLIFYAFLSVALLILYSTSFHHSFFFDDYRLVDGTIFEQYKNIDNLKVRLLSYGSFVWINHLSENNWWLQRLFNVILHIITTLITYSLLDKLLQKTKFSDEMVQAANFQISKEIALKIGVLFFAFNPVSVYAVAYLIQRSILMATLFVVASFWCWMKAFSLSNSNENIINLNTLNNLNNQNDVDLNRDNQLTKPSIENAPNAKHLSRAKNRFNHWIWYFAALLFYVLALLSKEHAVLAIAWVVPLYVFVQRPNWKKVLGIVFITGLALAGVAALLFARYGSIVGNVFDPISRIYVTQLDALHAGAQANLYKLSLLNQAYLFFQYGLYWIFPNVTWMSVDIRPAFPLDVWSLPYVLAAFSYVSLMIASFVLVVRKNDVLGLLALAVLLPLLLFLTEFATVWVQDPFVLYRSYLWALTLPLWVAIPLIGFGKRVLYPLGVSLACVLLVLSYERIDSLRTPENAWQDAAEKVDLKAPANAVGRWRPWLNWGAEQLEKQNYETAMRYFVQAQTLGEPMGSARMNMGVVHRQLKKPLQAIAEFNAAEAQGFKEPSLYYQRAEAFFALGQFAKAQADFQMALSQPASEGNMQTPEQATQAQLLMLARFAESAIAAQDFEKAQTAYQTLLAQKPNEVRYQLGLAMLYLGQKKLPEAFHLLNPLITQSPSAQVFYARALAHYFSGNYEACAQDLLVALRAEPQNPQFLALRERVKQAVSVASTLQTLPSSKPLVSAPNKASK